MLWSTQWYVREVSQKTGVWMYWLSKWSETESNSLEEHEPWDGTARFWTVKMYWWTKCDIYHSTYMGYAPVVDPRQTTEYFIFIFIKGFILKRESNWRIRLPHKVFKNGLPSTCQLISAGRMGLISFPWRVLRRTPCNVHVRRHVFSGVRRRKFQIK